MTLHFYDFVDNNWNDDDDDDDDNGGDGGDHSCSGDDGNSIPFRLRMMSTLTDANCDAKH